MLPAASLLTRHVEEFELLYDLSRLAVAPPPTPTSFSGPALLDVTLPGRGGWGLGALDEALTRVGALRFSSCGICGHARVVWPAD